MNGGSQGGVGGTKRPDEKTEMPDNDLVERLKGLAERVIEYRNEAADNLHHEQVVHFREAFRVETSAYNSVLAYLKSNFPELKEALKDN